MPLSQATTLSPNAQLIEHDPQADIEAICSMAESAQCFSPIVGIEQLDEHPWAGRSLHQPQSILLDVTGIAPLFGGENQLAHAVIDWVAAQGYLASIAIAGSVGTAWALANYRHRAQIAIELANLESSQDFHSVRKSISVLENDPSAGAITFLLPIEALRLDQPTATKLHRLGIRKIGQLVELPRAGLASRFDDRLIMRIDQTLNLRHEPILSLHASPDLAMEEILEHPTPLRETIDAVLKLQLQRLAQRLDAMGHGVIRLVCRIEMERNSIPVESYDDPSNAQPACVVRVFQIGLYQPSNEPEHLFWLLAGQLDAQYSKGKKNKSIGNLWAKSISIQATLTSPLAWRQSDLFDRHTATHRDAIAKLIDNLSARLGRAAVVAPTIHRDPQPELAYSWRPMTGWRKDGAIQETKRKLARAPKRDFANEQALEPNAAEHWRRPMRLMHPPKKIEVERVDTNGIPTQITYQGNLIAVKNAAGPERIDSGWWQGATQQRDYYRIELTSGSWLWIYRDRRDQNWYLHGEFD